MTPKDLYDHITKHLTPEEALMKLLESSLINYEKLKFDSKKNAVHPILIISMAALDLGWELAVDKNSKDIRGIIVGSKEYMDNLFNKEI